MNQPKARQDLARKCSNEEKNGQNVQKKMPKKSSKTLRGSARKNKEWKQLTHEKILPEKNIKELERQCPEKQTNG